jgi:hypothetical protein
LTILSLNNENINSFEVVYLTTLSSIVHVCKTTSLQEGTWYNMDTLMSVER